MPKNITKVYLLDVPLESDYKNTLYFNSLAGQQEYFQSRIVKSYTDFSYQRKDNIIRIPEEYDNIYNVNYVMYQNSAYSNKWFYAFIKDLKYVNDGMTEAVIETDVIQTWLFDYTVKDSFVEREHTSNDTIGVNTVPEGLETGEYIINSAENLDSGAGTYYICMGVSNKFPVGPNGQQIVAGGDRVYNGIYSGLTYLIFDDPISCSKMIKAYDHDGISDNIYCVFLAPTSLFADSQLVWDTDDFGNQTGIRYTQARHGSNPALMVSNKLIPINSTLNGYTPKNNKLKCWPYNYLYITNNTGANAIFRYEDFNGTPTFNIEGTVTPGCSIKLYPTNYKKYSNSYFVRAEYDYGLNSGKYPTCSWTTDAYTNWLTQNGVNLTVSYGSAIGTAVGGIVLTGLGHPLAGAGMVAGGIHSMLSTLGSMEEHSYAPDQARGNMNSGDVNASAKMTNFTAFKMSIKSEYASIIDGFFQMFGYKVNSVKVPNKAHRSRWWYTKCIDVSIDGNIPNDHLLKIKDCYNNGIRFWRNATEIENYSLSNDIAIIP